MFGMILWEEGKEVQRTEVLGKPFALVGVDRKRALTDRGLRRRVRAAGKRLRRLEVEQLVLPEGFAYGELLEELGLRPVSTCPLARALAVDWTAAALAGAESCVEVAVAADRLTQEVVQTVTALSLRYRYTALSVPAGGEELAARLRREYGVALRLGEGGGQARAAVLFSPGSAWEEGVPVRLRLYEEGLLPGLSLPEELEARLVPGADRGQLLSALFQAGALGPDRLLVTESGEMSTAGRDRKRQKVYDLSKTVSLDNSQIRPYNVKP